MSNVKLSSYSSPFQANLKNMHSDGPRSARRKRVRTRLKRSKQLTHIANSLVNAKERGEKMLDAGLIIIGWQYYLISKYDNAIKPVSTF